MVECVLRDENVSGELILKNSTMMRLMNYLILGFYNEVNKMPIKSYFKS